MIDFRLLGPLEARDGERVVELGRGKQAALLAMLLLSANEVVSRDRLIEALWGERASPSAGRAVTVYVSQLRKALEPGGGAGRGRVLRTHGPGYVLDLTDEQLDIRRFERLLAAGEQALADGAQQAAAERLREALDLWRGPALSDFAYASFAQPEMARLEELRLVALEQRIAAELALGHHAELVGELEGLARQYPLRERLRGQLMVALYRSGRQAEALEEYRTARGGLVEQLGVEPGPELQALHARILRHEGDLDVAPVAATGAAVGVAPGRRAAGEFTGRRRELAELEAGLDDALSGRGRLFLVTGEPGAGKSRLADELASRAKKRGAKVLWSRTWEAGGAPPLWPWLQLIRSYARGAHGELAGDDLARLAARAEEAARGAEPSFAAFDSIRTFFVRAAESRPLVVVLDDLQAADAESLRLLEFVADDVAEARLLVIAIARAAVAEPAVACLLAELTRHGANRLVLFGRIEAGAR